MKTNNKNQIIILVTVVCVFSLYYIFNTDRSIYKNIKTIDQTEMITIIGENSQNSYEFNDKMIDLVSYGGMIVKVDNLIVSFIEPYSNFLDKTDIRINYSKGDSILGTAQVFKIKDESDGYILYMNHVYWSKNSKIDNLLDLIQ
jgi:hypothetical protein